ncbi:SdrD B-like domain-containing protein [Scytonema sp. NUACC26]|uniref:SdrD B-like domain-containing protein n=1 Tax=Scytonema sp. NUACC26 TaxID=3140176 RepID=UPI0034DC4BC4
MKKKQTALRLYSKLLKLPWSNNYELQNTNYKLLASPRFLTFKQTLLTLLFTVPQVPLLGSISGGGKVLAQATSCPAGTTAQTLNWNPANNLAGITGQNLTINGINATISFTESAPGQVIDPNQTLITNDVYGGLPGPNLRFNIGLPLNSPAPVGSSATLTINFSQPITLASPLTLLDIDRDGARDTIDGREFIYQDRVTVNAFNGNTAVGVNLVSPGQYVRVTGNLAEGINENALTTESFGNLSVAIANPVNRIQITYQPGTEFGNPLQDETIGLTRLQICTPTGATGTIGDTVFNDANGNNVQDPGEVGIANVPLTLTSAGTDGQLGTADDTTQTTTTNNTGIYSFTNLPVGTYRVAVTTPPAGFTPTLTQPNPVTLAAGQTINTVDFGFQQGAGGTIGDTVFTDTNGNNVQDPGEPGLPNITLVLTGAGPDGQIGTPDDTSQTTTTNNNGNYSFTNLPPGTYRVTVNNPPAGFNPTLTQPNLVNLTAGQTINTVDFGFTQLAQGTIGDTVYTDTNANGVQDPGEPGISDRNISVVGAGSDGQFGTPDDINRTATTDTNGRYSIPNLPPGNYRVTVTNPPAGFNPTQTPPTTITVGASQNFDTADFGFTQQALGSIGDTVYTDTNSNNTQDSGEPGLGGRTVTLTGAGPDGQFGTPDDISRTTTTDSNGRYNFPNLTAGNYRVVVSNPPGGANPTQTPPATITLATGQNLDTADFGFTQSQLGSIGDTVFIDTNRNNTQDSGERGISGATVTLTGAGPDGQFGTPDDINRSATTDENGRYLFPDLPPSTYRVTVSSRPADFTPTLVPPETVTLAAGQNLNTVDFGFAASAVGAGEPNLRLVKRITNVLRNNQSIGGNFNTFDDGPGDDDNNINQLQPVRGVRDLQTPLQSGDEVEYTIYFLAQNTNDVRFCDLIPEGTSYSNGTIAVVGSGTSADQGTFFTPLAPLPPNNRCLSQTNSRGAVIVNFGTFGASSGNPSYIRFRVRVD